MTLESPAAVPEGPWRYVLVVDGRDLELSEGEVTIGRSRTATVRVDHESVSRTHALLTFTKGTAVLKDLNSSNGTYVSGRRVVNEVRVASGDRIQVGAAIIEYRLVETEAPVDRTALLPQSAQQAIRGPQPPPPPPPGRTAGGLPESGPEPVPPGALEISAGDLLRNAPDAQARPGKGVVAAASAMAAVQSSMVGPAPAPSAPAVADLTLRPGAGSPPPSGGTVRPASETRPGVPGRDPTLSQIPIRFGGAAPSAPDRARPSAPLAQPGEGLGDVQLAGFFPRLLATFVDGVILTAINLLLLSPVFLIYFFSQEFQKSSPSRDWAFLGISLLCGLLILAADVWYVVGGWARNGRTPGKALLRLTVVADEAPAGAAGIGLRTAVVRALGLLLSSLPAGIGFLLPLFRRDRRALHDLVAGTRVVRRR